MATPPKPFGTKRPDGHPAIEATDDDIRRITAMSGYGLSQRMMAVILGWSENTFIARKQDDPRVLEALERGAATAQANVGEALYHKATGYDPKTETFDPKRAEVGAIRWWEMTRAGRADRVRAVDADEDHPGLDEITRMSTEEKISGLRGILARHPKEPRGKTGKRRR